MRWSDATRPPTRRQLQQFSGLWVLLVAVLAGRRYLYGTLGPVEAQVAAVLGALGLVGLVWPPVMRWIYTTWMIAVFPIGWVVSRVILGVLYFCVFTPVAVVFRMIGRDHLVLRRRKTDTYWLARDAAPAPGEYLRQS